MSQIRNIRVYLKRNDELIEKSTTDVARMYRRKYCDTTDDEHT